MEKNLVHFFFPLAIHSSNKKYIFEQWHCIHHSFCSWAQHSHRTPIGNTGVSVVQIKGEFYPEK